MMHIRQSLINYFKISFKGAFSCFVIPAKPALAKAGAGIRRIKRFWIPGQARNDIGGRSLFLVRVEGESLWPYLIPGRRYLASGILAPCVGDLAVFRNPINPADVFVKRVAALRADGYIMESAVSWGSSSRDFGPVPRRLILGKIWR